VSLFASSWTRVANLSGRIGRFLSPDDSRRLYYDREVAAYRRVAAKGFSPAAVIDVGAYEGNWTRAVREVFPDAFVLMVEPQADKAPCLEATVLDIGSVRYERALLSGAEDERVTFYEMKTGSSMYPEQSNVARSEAELSTNTLDGLASDLEAPIFLKIDVQGAELEVLKGGRQTLSRTDLVQLEVALLPYNRGAPSFLEVLLFMDSLGFVPLDFSGESRPTGADLVQVDVLFCRQNSDLRPSTFTY
jgi:FkbM family methyltransferase